jgi:hypothetical protein
MHMAHVTVKPTAVHSGPQPRTAERSCDVTASRDSQLNEAEATKVVEVVGPAPVPDTAGDEEALNVALKK